MESKAREITGTGLKLIAVITMFIDHIGAGLIENWLKTNAGIISNDLYTKVFFVDLTLRLIGRMAFPIYCYMLVEGFKYTKDVKKYVMRLLGIAIISEVPFDYLFARKVFDWSHNNVLWALALGLVCLYAYSWVDKLSIDIRLIYVLRIAVMGAGMAIAYFTNLDYKLAGIGCISVMYYLNGETAKQRMTAFALGVLILVLSSSLIEVSAFLMLIPIYRYKGHQGANSPAIRRFFYLFYPAHIILLGVIAFLLKI